MRISDWSSDVCSSDLYRNRARRAEYLDAIQEMLARTNSHWAPWTVIDGNNQKAARIAALESIAEQLEARVPMMPPACDPELWRAAEDALGRKLNEIGRAHV